MHEVLVNRLGGLSLPRKNVVKLTDRPDMTLDVYRGRKTTMQQQQKYFYPFFFLSLYYMLTLKICVGVFSGIYKARMLKLYIHMDNEWLYCGVENGTPCSYFSLYLSIFLSFMAKVVSQFLRDCAH